MHGGYCAHPPAPIAKANRPAPLQACVWSTRRGLRVGVLDSFGGSFVWLLKPWLAHQSRSMVAVTLLADSTPSDHDSPNAPATARSLYFIAHPTARHRGLG